jgi:hypothetical protein
MLECCLGHQDANGTGQADGTHGYELVTKRLLNQGGKNTTADRLEGNSTRTRRQGGRCFHRWWPTPYFHEGAYTANVAATLVITFIATAEPMPPASIIRFLGPVREMARC